MHKYHTRRDLLGRVLFDSSGDPSTPRGEND